VLADSEIAKSGVLADAVRAILSDPTRRAEMESKIADFADPEANRRIWDEIGVLLNMRRK
jgi:UDP-N-acetylglucosamine:LPS N-acetylglucosamine transferase